MNERGYLDEEQRQGTDMGCFGDNSINDSRVSKFILHSTQAEKHIH
jgi:hypothetical protein